MNASAAARQTFAALTIGNYRRYYVGQAISLIGTWMQTVAQSWLVLELTHSATSIGLVVALQTLPILLLGPYGGVVADRVDKRRLMIVLQAMMGVLALVLGLLTVTGVVRLWEVYALALLLGLNNTFENPARQAFILEMVGPKDLRNAVTLNSVLVNAARAIGPAFAGIIIAAGGTGICFLVNAVSFAAVVISLLTLNVAALAPSTPTGRERGQLLEGLRYVRRTPNLATPLLMMGLVGCLGYEFQVVLPVLASQTFHGSSRTYGFMTATMGVGAVVGGLYAAAKGRIGLRSMSLSAAVFGVCFLGSALAPDLPVELVTLALLGAASVTFLSKGNSTLQLGSDPQMRGRVMALWAVAFMGSTPVGGPVAGLVSAHLGARAGLLLGAFACAGATILGVLALRRLAHDGTGSTSGTDEDGRARTLVPHRTGPLADVQGGRAAHPEGMTSLEYPVVPVNARAGPRTIDPDATRDSGSPGGGGRSHRAMAGGAVFVIAIVGYFLAQVVVAAAWHPAYSWSKNFISDLGNTACGMFAVPHGTATYVCSPRHALMNGSFAVTGLLTVAGAILLWGLVPGASKTRTTRAGYVLLLACGALKVLVGFAPENRNFDLHLLAAMNLPLESVAILAFSSALFSRQRAIAAFGIVLGIVGLIGTVLSTAAQYAGSALDLGLGNGGMERVAGYPGNLWLLVIGIIALGVRGVPAGSRTARAYPAHA